MHVLKGYAALLESLRQAGSRAVVQVAAREDRPL